MDRHIVFAPIDAFDRKPIDELRVGLTADPRQQSDPRRNCLAPPRQPSDRTVDARARLTVEPVGRILEDRLQPSCQRGQRLGQAFEYLCGGSSARHQSTVGLRELGLKPVSCFLRLRPREHGAAHLRQQAFDRPELSAFNQPLQPAVRRQCLGRFDRRVERARALVIVGRDIHQPRRQAPPPSSRTAFGPDNPAAQLDRLLSAERHSESRIGGVEQMMPLIEQDPARRVLPRSRRVDHHQSMIGDHDVGLAARPFGPLDEASAIVRTAGIDAFAPAVGQRSRPRPTE